MTLADAIAWAREAEAGDYLVEYDDLDDNAEDDPGSRCGFGDDELDAINRVLRVRDLTLNANDCGLVAEETRP